LTWLFHAARLQVVFSVHPSGQGRKKGLASTPKITQTVRIWIRAVESWPDAFFLTGLPSMHWIKMGWAVFVQ